MSEQTVIERLAVIEAIGLRVEQAVNNHIEEDKAVEKRVQSLEKWRARSMGIVAAVLFVEPIVLVFLDHWLQAK